MIILLLEQNICNGQKHECRSKVNPMPGDKTQSALPLQQRAKVYEAQRHCKLQKHIYATHKRMRHLQLICHQLIGVLAMGLPELLVQQDTVTNGQTAIDAVNQQENQSNNVPGLDDQHSYGKEEDEGDSDAAHISCEAFCLSPRTEIEEREDKHAQQNDNEKRILNK